MADSESVTTTRTTRLVFVEEILDTKRRNSTYKSFESETNVEEIKKSTSDVKAGKPPQETPRKPDKKTSTMTSPIKKTSKNRVAPAEIRAPKKLADDVTTKGLASDAPQPSVAEQEQNLKNALNSTGPAPAETEVTKISDDPKGEVPKSPQLAANGDVTGRPNGSVGPPGDVTTDETTAASLQKDALIKDAAIALLSAGGTGPAGGEEPALAPIPVPTPVSPAGPPAAQPVGRGADVERGMTGGEDAAPAPLAEMRTFSKAVRRFGAAGGGAGGGDGDGDAGTPGADEMSARRSTRRNMLQSVRTKRQFDNEDEKGIDESLLYETLRPLFLLMKFTGIFFIRKKGQFGKSVRERLRSATPLQGYCLAVCGLLFLNFTRSMFSFNSTDGFSNALFLKFLSAIFMYESTSRAVLAYWHSYRKVKGLQQFFLGLEKICYSDQIIPYEVDLKRVMRATIIISIVISLSNMGSNAYGMFGSEANQFDSALVPAHPDAPGIEAMKLFVLVLVLMNGLVAMFSLSLFTTICYVLYKEFEYLCRTFVMKIKEDGTFTDNLEKFRLTHQKRCKLVEDADCMFKYYIANTYMTNVPLLCMLLYVIVYAEGSDLSYRLINSFRLFYVLVQMVVVSCAATMINNQAHAPLGDVYSIRVLSASSERQLEVNMFLNKLTGTQIGLTAWDMFVINKPTVLTVVGMVLTYFFLLVQFKNPLGEPTPCRCMVNVTSDVLRALITDVTTDVIPTTDLVTYNST